MPNNTQAQSHRWLIFLAVSLVAIIINLDATVINLALVTIAKVWQASLSQLQWIVNIYMLMGVIFLTFSGRLADLMGRRVVYLIGIALFTVASLIAGLASNQWVLIAARGLQGLGFAFTISLGIVIVTSVFPSNKRGFALGCYMTVAGLSQALGPTLGGVILTYFSWRWIFIINVPLGLAAISLIFLFYPNDRKAHAQSLLDYVGVTWLGIGLLLWLLALNEFGEWGVKSHLLWGVMAIGAAFLILFYHTEKHSKKPLIDFQLFYNRRYWMINLIRFLYMCSWLSIMFCIPFYLQTINGYNPLQTGYVLFSMTFVFGILSPAVGFLLDKRGVEKPLILAMILSLVTFVLFAYLQEQVSLTLLVSGLILFGIGMPIVGTGSAVMVAQTVPEKSLGVGMGILYMLAFLGASFGVAISGSLITLLGSHGLNQAANAAHLTLSLDQWMMVKQIMSGARSTGSMLSYFNPHELQVLIPLLHSSFMNAFKVVIQINMLLMGISFLLSVLLIKRK